MGLFDFWKVKTDFRQELYQYEKASSNKLFEVIIQVRETLEVPSNYDAENNWDTAGYTDKVLSEVKIYEFYNRYSDDQFSRLLKFKLKDGMSEDENGNYVTFEDQLSKLGREIFSHSMKRANIKLAPQNQDAIALLISKNQEALSNLSKYSENIGITTKTLIHYCSSKDTILNKELTVNDVEDGVLCVVLENTKRIA
ncbi:hypothetical protein [Flavobacterium acetivorans]|uniref:hypothetical protein n=1 Tax=Flavobacterium acetivorans TaxID=2893883 RepID=UPI001E2DC025|nr:hypothetical protein [Flavobacterium sp. F-29]UFH36057.1 hypothetical protein LNP19_03210 [Flavobacterium sp. F-29]